MLLFEEFFKKKKIDLGNLQQREPSLFSEFKDHYEQMGEKSFDHTKKYWFNKLRREFPLPPEVKAERLRPENPIAEQAIADALTEPAINAQPEAPKPGFKPRSKTPVATPPPATEILEAITAPEAINTEAETPAKPKVSFTPRFKAGVTAKPADEQPSAETSKPADTIDTPTEQPTQPKVKVGFKPRFKPGVTTTKPAEENAATTGAPQTEMPPENEVKDPVEQSAVPSPKIGFKPRFKAGVTTSKPVEDETAAIPFPQQIEESTDVGGVKSAEEVPAEPTAKLGFKPRFKAGVTTSKPAEETQPTEQAPAIEDAAQPAQEIVAETPDIKAEEPATEPAPKPAYKPRFNPAMAKRKPTDEQ